MLDKEQLCNEILKVDDKIRFTAIYDEGEFTHKMREGLESYQTPVETENSLAQSVYRWHSRKKATPKIGEPIYAMAKYEKVYRIVISAGVAGVMIVTTELNVNVEEIVEKIRALRDKYYQ